MRARTACGAPHWLSFPRKGRPASPAGDPSRGTRMRSNIGHPFVNEFLRPSTMLIRMTRARYRPERIADGGPGAAWCRMPQLPHGTPFGAAAIAQISQQMRRIDRHAVCVLRGAVV